MTIAGVTDYAILAIFRHRMHYNCTSIALFRLAGPATVAGIIACANACACAFICPPGLLGTPRSLLQHRGGGLRAVWALIPGHSPRDLPLVGTRGGSGRGSCWGEGLQLPAHSQTRGHRRRWK